MLGQIVGGVVSKGIEAQVTAITQEMAKAIIAEIGNETARKATAAVAAGAAMITTELIGEAVGRATEAVVDFVRN